MGYLAVGPDKAPAFCNMFILAQNREKSDNVLDGIVNQWMICEAKRQDRQLGKKKRGPTERALKGSMISTRHYLY